MFEFCVRWFTLGLDTSLKAVLLALLAAAALKALRVQDSNMRHRVWLGVLGGMLLLPALTLIVPALRLPLPAAAERWMALRDVESASESLNDAASPSSLIGASFPSQEGIARLGELAGNAASMPGGRDRVRFSRMPAGNELALTPSPAADDSSNHRPIAIAGAITPVDAAAQAAQPRRRTWRVAALAVTAGCLLWLGGALTMTSRLLLGLLTARSLIAESLPLESANLTGSSKEPIPVRECPLIRVPLTIGCCRPQILLPPEWINWPVEKLRAVLAHERMHAARGDCAVALVAEMNCCLYWFHPLAWWLGRQLSSLAEQACDDAAIDSTGDRAQYARHLLEVAAAALHQRGRLVPTGVSMARRSNVESRILAILDFTRPLSRRLTWLSTLGLVAVMIPLIALAAALQPTSSKQEDAQPDSAAIANGEQPKDAVAPPDKPSKAPAEDATLNFAGSVVDHRGQPVAAADIAFGYLHEKQAAGNPPQLATTDEQGRFQFSRKRSDLIDKEGQAGWVDAGLIATKDGYGFAIGAVQYFDTSGQLDADLTERQREIVEYEYGKKSSVLTLVADDVPIRGRVFDSEGRPIVGAKIELASIWQGTSGTLDAWEAAVKQPGAEKAAANKELRPLSIAGYAMTGNYPLAASHLVVVPPVRTDDDGRFTLQGVGRDRIVQLYVSGQGIATLPLHVRSRRGDSLRVIERSSLPDLGSDIYHPAEFTCIASPSVPVEGRVTDKRTGQPLAGFVVRGYKIATNEVHGGLEAMYIHTRTDTDGRYKLEGLPLGENTFQIAPPQSSPHLASNVAITTTVGSPPLVRDVALSTGVKVRGRVTDSRSGKPLEGNVTYFAFDTNPHLREVAGFYSPTFHHRSDADGRYEIQTLPGPGILAFRADDGLDYPHGIGADRIDGPKSVTNAIFFQTVPWRLMPDNFHLVTALNPAPDAAEVDLDLTLTSGASFSARVRTADGQPLGEYYVHGDGQSMPWMLRKGESFQVKGYFAKEGRRVMVYEPQRNLVGLHDVTGDAPESLEIVVKPGGTLIGRIVDAEGLPLEGLSIYSEWGNENFRTLYSPAVIKMRGQLISYLDGRQGQTNQDGRFELKGIMPGLSYTASVSGPTKRNGRQQMTELGSIFRGQTAAAGQTKDLGDLRISNGKDDDTQEPKPDEKVPAPAAATDPTKPGAAPAMKSDKASVAAPPMEAKGAAAASENPAASPNHKYRGRVVDAQGRPIAGVMFRDAEKPTGTPLGWMVDLFKPAKVVSDADGWFTITFSEEEATGGSGFVVSHAGYALEWFDFPDEAGAAPQNFVLYPERPIAGRLIDSEGRPIVGASVEVKYVWAPLEGATLDPFLEAWKREQHDAMTQAARQDPVLPHSLAAAKSDAAGRFVIKGLAAERACAIQIKATDFAMTTLILVNREGFDGRPYNEAVPQVMRRFSRQLTGPDRAYVCLPDYKLEGRITTAGGKPVAGAAVSGLLSYMGQETVYSDSRGRYRLSGLPRGDETLVSFSARDGLLERTLGISARSDESRKTLDVVLSSGVVVKGRVTDPITGKGVRGRIRFVPLPENEFAKQTGPDRNASGDHVADDGRFEVLVLPGPGVIMMQSFGQGPTIGGEQFSIYRQARFSDADRPRIKFYNSDTQQFFEAGEIITNINNENFVKYVDYPADGQPQTLNFQLDRGQTVDVEFVDPEGKPLPNAFASGIAEQWPIAAKLTGPQCTVYALGPDRPRRLVFLHAERRLAGTVMLTGEEKSPLRVTLSEAASLRGRAIDEAGNPLADVAVNAIFQHESASELYRFHPLHPARTTTDAEGRFTIDSAVPGEQFFINIQSEGKYFRPKPNSVRTLNAGQHLDLKDIVFAASD